MSEVKSYLRIIDQDEDDDNLLRAIARATTIVEEALGRQIITADYRWQFSRLPYSGAIKIPRGKTQTILTFDYLDSAGTSQAFTDYTLLTTYDPAQLIADDEYWPTTDTNAAAVTITFRCGYGTGPLDVPENLRQLLLWQTAFLWELPDPLPTGSATKEIPRTLGYLVDQLRIADDFHIYGSAV